MPRCIYERGLDLWHIAGIGDEDFMPIVCSEDEGIVAPGNIVTRKPTCPDCVERVKARRRATASRATTSS